MAALFESKNNAASAAAPSGQNLALATTSDSKPVTINSRNYTQTSGDSIAFQAKPASNATTTGDLYGCQISPRVLNTFDGASMIGGHFEPIIKGTGTVTGTLSGDIRALQTQVTDEDVAGKTISGDIVVGMRVWHQLANHTVTGDVCVFRIDSPGGAKAYTCFTKFQAAITNVIGDKTSAGIAFSTLTNTGNAPGYLLVKLGSTAYKIPLYNNA